jgi:hypothetical protein
MFGEIGDLFMYKRSLLAAAVAAASIPALAATLGNGASTKVTPTYSLEALAANDEVLVGTTAMALTTRPTLIRANSIFTFDYGKTLVADGGAAFTPPNELALDVRSFLTGTYAGTSFATNGTLTLSGSGTNPLRYIILSGNAPDFTVGAVDYSSLAVGLTSAIQLPTPYVSTTGLTGVTVSAEYENEDGVSTETATGSILTVGTSQMAGGTITGNATIDVNELKKEFLTTGTSTTLTLTYDKDAIAAGAAKIPGSVAATTGTVGITITGQDFSWLDTDATTAGIQLDGNVTGLSSITVTETTITGVVTDTTTESVAVQLTNSEEAVIPVQTGITAGANIFYPLEDGTNGSTQVSMTGSAVWSLNGSSIDVYAVPNSENVSVFMWLTNTGTGSVALDATLYDNGQTCEMTNIGSSVAGTEFDLSAALSDAVEAQCSSYVPSGNRVRYNVTANAPANSIRISAAYRVGTDRVNLLTSSEVQ